MLMTKDVVKVADSTTDGKKAGLTKYFGTFDRPYLSHGSQDELDTEKVKFRTTDNGEVEVEITSPKYLTDDKGKSLAVQTKSEPRILLKEALDYYESEETAKKAKDADYTPVSPILRLLSDADDGLVSRLRMRRRNELIPTEIDEDKAVLKQATVMHRANPKKFPSVEDAVKALKALYA